MDDLAKDLQTLDSQLFQKARIKWIVEGDANTRFFHNIINRNYKMNEITGLSDGASWVDSLQGVKKLVFNHFRSYFSWSSSYRARLDPLLFSKKIGVLENIFLEAPFTMDEVKDAIWNCESSSSPGPDGFSFGFYKENWETLKEDIMRVMEEFFHKGKIVKGLNLSFIVLIPKKAGACVLDEFRPISLLEAPTK
ncbi:hypothetical protein ACS0TY_013093 [Phlomoides rotata]